MDPIIQQILSGHTQSINELNAGLLALVEIVRDAELTTMEKFDERRAEYLAQIEQAVVARHEEFLNFQKGSEGPTD